MIFTTIGNCFICFWILCSISRLLGMMKNYANIYLHYSITSAFNVINEIIQSKTFDQFQKMEIFYSICYFCTVKNVGVHCFGTITSAIFNLLFFRVNPFWLWATFEICFRENNIKLQYLSNSFDLFDRSKTFCLLSLSINEF